MPRSPSSSSALHTRKGFIDVMDGSHLALLDYSDGPDRIIRVLWARKPRTRKCSAMKTQCWWRWRQSFQGKEEREDSGFHLNILTPAWHSPADTGCRLLTCTAAQWQVYVVGTAQVCGSLLQLEWEWSINMFVSSLRLHCVLLDHFRSSFNPPPSPLISWIMDQKRIPGKLF